MDAAFVHLGQIVADLADFEELRDEEAGVRSYVHRAHIESPVELSIRVAADGAVEIGSTPPLYRVETSIRPSYHRLAFTAVVDAADLPEPLDPSFRGEAGDGE